MHMLQESLMSAIEIAGPPLTYVSWGCKRCGFTGGVANTTFPLDPHWTEEMGRTLFRTLRQKLVRKHQRLHGCIATLEDFAIGPHIPQREKAVIGVIR